MDLKIQFKEFIRLYAIPGNFFPVLFEKVLYSLKQENLLKYKKLFTLFF